MKKKKRKKKDKSLTWYKDKAWELLSKIRRLEEADQYGYVYCVTCGLRILWKAPVPDGAQAGHFIDGRTNAILWDERGIHPQCYVCNCCKSGNKVEYTLYVLKRYGQEIVDELRWLGKQTRKIYREEYKEMIIGYKERLKELYIKHNL